MSATASPPRCIVRKPTSAYAKHGSTKRAANDRVLFSEAIAAFPIITFVRHARYVFYAVKRSAGASTAIVGVVDSEGLRTREFALPRETGALAPPAFAVLRSGRRALVVTPHAAVFDVDLETLAVRRHELPEISRLSEGRGRNQYVVAEEPLTTMSLP